jgi:hypothetical protein
VALLLVGLLVGGGWYLVSAYRSFARSARDDGIDKLVAKADELSAYAAGVLQTASSAEPARARVAQDKPMIFDARVRPDGMVEWDAVLIATGSDRSSWSDSSIAVRACIRLAGRPGPRAAVRRTNLTCPQSVNDPRKYGSYEETVALPTQQ